MTKYFAEVVRASAKVATGILGWTPDVFWNATPAELQLALEGRFGEPVVLGGRELARLRENLGDG